MTLSDLFDDVHADRIDGLPYYICKLCGVPVPMSPPGQSPDWDWPLVHFEFHLRVDPAAQ